MDQEEYVSKHLGNSQLESNDRDSGLTSPVNVPVPADFSQSADENAAPQQHQFDQQTTRMGSLDMNNVAAALPEYAYGQLPHTLYQQQYPSHVQHPQMGYLHQHVQYPANIQSAFSPTFATHMHPQAFQTQRSPTHFAVNSGMGVGQHMFHGQPYYGQQPPITPISQNQFHHTPQTQPYGHGHATMYAPRTVNQYYGPQIRIDNFTHPQLANQTFDATYYQNETSGIRRTSSTTSLNVSSALRGPPRKPKQSGHALWVGNLPPGTNILDLKDHFSRDATEDIESVFLISKSNCAFVNYKTESSCTAAMARFHDSRFNGVRLVCRLRRGSSPSSATTPSGISLVTTSDSRTNATSPSPQTPQKEPKQNVDEEATQVETKVLEKYFIIKSLTVEDLERSVHNGIWATQSHNEELLNKAYQTAEDVYLIFSANKSGEYFGYARMDSAIDDESASNIDSSTLELQPAQPTVRSSNSEVPLTIPTPATKTAPSGYIIDDSARGTIFWEAEQVLPQPEPGSSGTSPEDADSGDDTTEVQQPSPARPTSATPNATFGKPFKITWMSTERLPFYRTRGLRNPWNTNREVKIARDGTELEPNVGKKLVSMFHMGSEAGRQQPYSGILTGLPGHGPAYRPF